MSDFQSILKTAAKVAEQVAEDEQFKINAKDFLSAKPAGGSKGTEIAQLTTSLAEASQVLNRSFVKEEKSGGYTNVISPVVMPKDSRSFFWPFETLVLLVVGVIGWGFISTIPVLSDRGFGTAIFGPHYFLLVFIYAGFRAWKNSYVMIPDGCQALITKFGKVVETVGPGYKRLLSPWTRVGYVVNTTREYPYNAPIRKAPTQGRVEASVDLFLQFKIENPSEFIFTLGGATGFSEKLHHAISEETRSLIYKQKAEGIYDLVGESTQNLLDTLNKQFLPAVRFVNANITHAEPSNQEYRMDLASPEVIRVAKEAYTYQYELNLRKEQDEGDLNKELASLREKLSDINADIATYQAQIDTAHEKAINRSNAYASRLLIEAESEAKANAALLEAQSLDIKAVNSARYPEILEYRYQQTILDEVEGVSNNLPQIVNLGEGDTNQIDYMSTARQMLGVHEDDLYSEDDIKAMRTRLNDVTTRIQERNKQIADLRIQEEQVLAEGGV